jgi:hypothetical protein
MRVCVNIFIVLEFLNLTYSRISILITEKYFNPSQLLRLVVVLFNCSSVVCVGSDNQFFGKLHACQQWKVVRL